MKLHILVIDDHAVIRDLLADILARQGHEVDRAENGMEGLTMAYRRQYDIIISDVDMPVMNGIEFYKRLIKTMPFMRQRILFITGNKDGATDAFLQEMGVRRLSKPFTTVDLLEAVQRIDILHVSD
ncbi:MAG: hypothetical protein A2X87_08480 [Deltaproteobacteria bacterium GWC2_42_51]|nr:MAG: hypothetical protein A2056_05440 [Deltaproteobacteria bacterium GWA2_42_85]OGP35416.1 MAG: hypothetical protein A2X87_08480 [Deltaproteobacteria bacterium GWC2_42_51]OGP41526.1 MAG: hypothetical protein A2090_05200 [Deltaproteobacteria bacterium GWD2_42_10]OGP48358.1 MAG: hypothetical protein A2022_10195 [Deltaproteobacteria bacterium GWF2_42_12]OGQ25116.1 MAG: hypothetical protein A3D29_01640 [Deltaproteobacteria bacterium RIFCSPHIGHO2_02_FULL_42_44]OGQ37120.1 MAG: hypothetical protei